MSNKKLILYAIIDHRAHTGPMLCVYPGLMSRTWLSSYEFCIAWDLMDENYSTNTGTMWLTTTHQTCGSNFWVHHIWKLAFSPKMTGTLEVICSTGWRRMPAGFRVNHFPSSIDSYNTALILTSTYCVNCMMPTFGAPSPSLATDLAMPRDFYIKLDSILESFDERWLEVHQRLEAIEAILQVWTCLFGFLFII